MWMSGGEGGILASKYHADVRGDGGSKNRFPPWVGSGSFLERPIADCSARSQSQSGSILLCWKFMLASSGLQIKISSL